MRKLFILLLLPFNALATNLAVLNSSTNTLIEGQLCCEKVSIASISKLMTIYTVLSANQDLDEKLIVPETKIHGRLSKGMEVSRLDLIKLALVSSDNVAATTLAENYIGGEHGFVESMNSNAKKLNMNNTGFVEPTGLSVMNYSTTGDVITLTNALVQYKIFKDAGQTKELSILVRKNKKMMILHSHPTSTYFGDEKVIALKTGFTNAAGFCITMLVNVNNQNYNIVILGSRTPAERSKIIRQTLARLK